MDDCRGPVRAATDRSLATWVVVLVTALGLVAPMLVAPSRAEAAVASSFRPGAIISDAVFYDHGTMTEAEIQAFLTSRGSGCTAGEMPCLKDYRESTTTRPLENGLCWQYSGASNESAARILRKVATACEINPRVLLVMLEKENSLVTRTRPTTRSYQAAMGFGCPDTAPCNTEYYGFSNQVYRAARQFLVYRQNATRYGYQAGRTNTIRYNPDASCGSSQVYIENQATAALYIYTPYQPNTAALANLYGSGDACSAYGNRNFWRLFTDWFGDPATGSSLVRTEADPQVYLLSGARRHPVPDLSVYNEYVGRLGPVGYVSSALLARYGAGPALGRVVRDESDGAIYWVARGVKYHFPSCDVVVRWSGSSCTTAYVDLTASQVAEFATGVSLGSSVRTTGGRSYVVEGAAKREILDEQSRVAAGIPASQATVPDVVVASLAVAAPVVRPDVVVTARGTTSSWLLMSSGKHALADDVRTGTGLRQLAVSTLDAASLDKIATGAPIGLYVRASATGSPSILTRDGLVPAPPGSPAGVVLSPAVAALLPVRPAVNAPFFVKAPTGTTVWAVETVGGSAQRRSVGTWQELQSFAGTNPRILTVAASLISAAPRRTGAWTAPGRLVKGEGTPEVYLVNGLADVVHVESFADVAALGLSRSHTTVPAATMRSYNASARPLSPVVRCGDRVLVGVSGRLVARGVADPAVVPVTTLSAATCARLPAAGPTPAAGPLFLKGSAATVYVGEGSTLRPVQSWNALVRLNAGHGTPLIVTLSDRAIGRLPQGAPIS